MADENLTIYTAHILGWYRYIDDIFIIWDGFEDMLQQCLLTMNRNDFNLSFTMSFDKKCITFLDVEIYKGENGKLCSKLYRKPTVGNTILDASSFHPQPLIDSIPYNQYLRTKRNCTDGKTFVKEAAKL